MDTIQWRHADQNDVDSIIEMRQDDSTRDQLHDCRKFSHENCSQWISEITKSLDAERWVFEKSIELYHSGACGEFIGLARIDKIDHINQTCCVGLDIHPKQRKKGFGRYAWEVLLEEMFTRRNMHLVWLEVLDTNEVAKSLYEKLGFVLEGKLRGRILRNSQRIDSLIMSMTREEWQKCEKR